MKSGERQSYNQETCRRLLTVPFDREEAGLVHTRLELREECLVLSSVSKVTGMLTLNRDTAPVSESNCSAPE